MWLFTTRGFVSVTRHREDPALLVVRSRCRADLKPFRKKIIATPDRDYQFRVIVSRAEFRRHLEVEVDRIDYANFKDACPDARHSMLLQIWGVVDSAFRRPWVKMRRSKRGRRLEYIPFDENFSEREVEDDWRPSRAYADPSFWRNG